jgi:putative ABC transport system permease protein
MALALGQFLRGMLFAVTPADPVALVAVPIVMLMTTAVATAVPALRASRVDPIHALRSE